MDSQAADCLAFKNTQKGNICRTNHTRIIVIILVTHAKQYLRAKQLTGIEETPWNKALHMWRQLYCMRAYMYMYSLILRVVKSMANNLRRC